MKGRRHVSGGRRGPRDVLRMAALSATVRNAEMKALRKRLRERGGRRKVALAGVMRRPVATANVPLRDRRVREAREGAPRGSGRAEAFRNVVASSPDRPTGTSRRAGSARPSVDRAVDGLRATGCGAEKARKEVQIRA